MSIAQRLLEVLICRGLNLSILLCNTELTVGSGNNESFERKIQAESRSSVNKIMEKRRKRGCIECTCGLVQVRELNYLSASK